MATKNVKHTLNRLFVSKTRLPRLVKHNLILQKCVNIRSKLNKTHRLFIKSA
ncbi:hypothetical protein PAGA_a2387 [Pseudoalteromonas agarivorans DSM 14585]|uniref:Uncharacterized protein n=1 Tax=Pseudoalteromonas agarivorans DSM 14585 TaxID=1312369 RepID=A0ACA8DWV3_9GAMM|nr:hypothetical protein PAGA_a2387 [Pseudoalteromonas agarivorans DSM 14585]